MRNKLGRAVLFFATLTICAFGGLEDSITVSVMVLLIEDEPMNIDVVESELTDTGYEVFPAQNGTKAPDEIEADVSRFRARATDIRLGSGPDGWLVAQRARELAPHSPVVYMSGDSSHEWASKGVPGSAILAKPFAPVQLVTAPSALATEADMHTPPAADGGPVR